MSSSKPQPSSPPQSTAQETAQSTAQTALLTITAPSPDMCITIYDGFDRILHQANAAEQRQVTLDLPMGLYMVRSSWGGAMEERMVRHTSPSNVEAPRPPQFSAALLAGAATSHEYYTYPSMEWSKDLTAPPIVQGGAPSAGLFIFIRASDQETYKGQNLAENLSVRSATGKVVCDFAPNEIRRTTKDGDKWKDGWRVGWLACSMRATPGHYFLRFAGQASREMPLHLYPNWQTQVFLTHHGRPLFDSIRVFMAHLDDGFNPSDAVADAVDKGLTALQNNMNLLPHEVMEILLHGKFDNPMLGLIGAHLLLRQDKPRQDIIRLVLSNLKNLLPHSPDVQALRLLSASRFGQALPQTAVRHVPMLRAGLDAVLAAAVDAPDLLPEDGLIENIAPRLHTDSPWSSWIPSRSDDFRTTSRSGTSFMALGGGAEARALVVDGGDYTNFADQLQSFESFALDEADSLDWVQTAILDTLESNLKSDKSLNPSELARRLQLPSRTVKKALRNFQTLSPNQVSALAGEWQRVGAHLAHALDSGQSPQEALTNLIHTKTVQEVVATAPEDDSTNSLAAATEAVAPLPVEDFYLPEALQDVQAVQEVRGDEEEESGGYSAASA